MFNCSRSPSVLIHVAYVVKNICKLSPSCFARNAVFELFECDDVETLLQKLAAINVRPFISGWVAAGYGDKRYVTVSDYELPEAMRPRAQEIAEKASSWVGKEVTNPEQPEGF